MKELQTDILVIGGGLSGLSASLTARKNGCSVVLICKSIAGHSGNTAVSGASLSVFMPENMQGDTKALFKQDLLKSGAEINNLSAIQAVLDTSCQVLPFLEEYGVKFRYLNGERMAKRPGGHSSARYYSADIREYAYSIRGMALSEPMETSVRRSGATILNGVTALQLTKADDGAVNGCVCYDCSTKELIRFHAKSVILAAGGGASLFEYTDNTSDVSCDSYRLAAEAGAKLQDMEFVQFFPCVMFEPIRLPVSSALFGDGATLRNARGEAFMCKYSPAGDRSTRDIMARAVKTEIDAGRGNPKYVFVDCTAIPEKTLIQKYGEITSVLRKHGIDILHDYIPVAPAAHFYMGGICVDDSASTGIKGLFACGEAVGGLHGANRLAGVALTEAVVSGKLAGDRAAKEAKTRNFEASVSIRRPAAKKELSVNWDEWICDLRKTAWRDASIVRNKESLSHFSEYLDAHEKEARLIDLDADRIVSAYRYKSYFEAARMLLICAKAREESRGSHFRSDYPEQDNAFRGNFICCRNDFGKYDLQFISRDDQ